MICNALLGPLFWQNKKSIVKYITIQWHCVKKTDYVLMINEALN